MQQKEAEIQMRDFGCAPWPMINVRTKFQDSSSTGRWKLVSLCYDQHM